MPRAFGVLRGGLNQVKVVLAAAAALVAVAVCAPLASAARPKPNPVPSLTPVATQKLWTKLVHRRHVTGPLDTTGCRALRAVFYTETDWLRLATKLAANPSPCAQYYISIPPLAADKTKFRYDQPWRIRALGPQFHVLAEISYNGWTNWVTANNSDYYQAGLEARRRMAANGFDVAAGDGWSVNEFSSAVRNGTGVARQKVEDLVRGLYEGDGTVPQVKGVVFDIGYGQSTVDLSSYKLATQNWLLDSSFWNAMSPYVSDWSQEVYGDARDYAVSGASAATRASYLNDYLQHQLSLAGVAPPEAAAASTFLNAAYTPLANAAWIYNSGYGFTNVDEPTMADFVSAQTYAMRSFDAGRGSTDRFGFAWAPKMVDNSAWTSDFTAQSGQVIDRLAAAIHDSGASPDAACTNACSASLADAAFTDTWKTFGTWSPPALGFTTASVTVAAAVPSTQLAVRLQQVGIAQNATVDTVVTLASSSANGVFSTSASGPWTSSLSVTIPTGTSSASFYYEDTTAGNPTITATTAGRQAATQVETVTSGGVASLSLSPTSASIPLGSSQTFTVSGVDAYGNRVTPNVTWSAATGTLSTTSGTSTTFTAATTGTATVTATDAGGATATATVSVTTKPASVSSITYSRSGGYLYVTIATVPNATVGLTILRSGTAYANGSVNSGSTGKVTVRVYASKGCYSTTITSLNAAGYTWDGRTPSNGICF
jgi:hypothetical protein